MTLRASAALFAAILSIGPSVAQAQMQDPGAAQIMMEASEFNYGVLDFGASGSRMVKFRNTGKRPLVITSIQSSCGCLTAEIPKAPLAPGATGEIRFKYDTKRPGVFRKTMTIASNAGTEPSVVFTVKGEIRPDPNPPASGSMPPK
ncbi:DUF1573 domain-containing protein [Blastomonas sp. SL216]|uniref:DUF1573 domain-containing protein n=1 Tax=Blastomonas sp. SL216 TaxID=2995169 RepID=UPI00237717E9|nr:DUF1573 domain-containing protein [Blastomonas sp. SL216]